MTDDDSERVEQDLRDDFARKMGLDLPDEERAAMIRERHVRPPDAIDLTSEELAAFEADALAGYRRMIGADLPPAERGRLARIAARRIPPITDPPWKR